MNRWRKTHGKTSQAGFGVTLWCGHSGAVGDRIKNLSSKSRPLAVLRTVPLAAQFTENAGTKCGYGVNCIPLPHRGVCLKGWHMPTMAEYDTLYKAIGFESAAVYLMSTNRGWNGLDLYGFSV